MDNHCIVDPNAQAVQLMQEGSYNQASVVLRDILKQIQSSLPIHTIADQETNTNTRHSATVDNVPVSEMVHSKEHSAAFYLYAQAFLFNPSEQELLLISSQQLTLATLLYNLALSQHLRALLCDKMQQARFQFSLKMYEQAIQCLDEVPMDLNSLPVRLAILNNKAHIYSTTYERKGMQHCLQYMESLLQNNVPKGIERDEYYQFHMNILLFEAHSNVQSASAA
jgi:hypothetical protein